MFVATKTLPMDVIRIDGGTQSRLKIRTDKVDEYAERMTEGVEFPPGVAFFDGKEYWLADGFHRYHALRKARKVSMSCNVANGTVRDAILYSFGANGQHGLPMSNEDKWHIVSEMLNDFEWGEWSDREIGRRTHTSHVFVAKVRASIKEAKKATDKASEPAADTSRKFKDKAGNVTTMRAKEPKFEPPVAEVTAVDEQKEEAINLLIKENEELKDKMAAQLAANPEEAKSHIEELREELNRTKSELETVIKMRDMYQAENAQLKKQVAMYQKQLKKAA